MAAENSQDDIATWLHAVARGEGGWGDDDWSSTVLLTSRLNAEAIDIAAFRRFQASLLSHTGLRAVVTGAMHGCTRLKVRLVATRSSDDPVRAAIEALRTDRSISAPLLESGFTVLRSETDLDIRSGKTRPGNA